MRIVPASDSALLVVFGDEISEAHHSAVAALFRHLQSLVDPRIRNLHPAYSSLLIDFDPLRTDHEELSQLVKSSPVRAKEKVQRREIELPVCYGEEFGPDLVHVAEHARLGVEDVVRLHSQSTYNVSFLGFSPGFGYLSRLPQQLVTPRHGTPRGRVVAGSVGIAGEQTGVYPVDSPGGWQIIGCTPMQMFSALREPPALLQIGDVVRFRPIPREEFYAIAEDNRSR
jgi:KipI family sensor histidine kinase inhibitor